MTSKTDGAHGTLADGVRIGEWELHPTLHEIRRDGEVLRLEPKVAALLIRLTQRAGAMVTREELLTRVWPGVVVGDDSLTQVVIKLRKALGDDPKHPRYIQTIPKQGYRLIAPVSLSETPGESAQEGPVRRGDHRPRLAAMLIVGIVVAAVAIVGYLTVAERPPEGTATVGNAGIPGHPRPKAPVTIAVLPFESLRAGADQDNLARGITADLVTDLSRLSGLWVISTHSIFGHDDRGAANGALTARYYVSGSVQRSAKRLEAHVRLIDSSTGRQLWSEKFDRPIGDLFDVQAEISRRVAKTLSIKLTQAEHWRLAKRYTRNLEAYELFLQGQGDLLVRQERENLEARRLYRRAIELDPTFARAYAGLALSYVADYRNQWGEHGAAALERASKMAHTARDMDPGIPEVYWVLGYIQAQRRHHERAIVLLKNAPAAGHLYFLLLGRAYFFMGDQEQARINLREALSRNPANLEAHVYMAAVAVAAGDRETAQWEVAEIQSLQPDFAMRDWLATYPMTDADQIAQLTAALTSLGL
ncbi:MAG: winged helix-turn-helix domain-containing protein [Gammaproteobacteria bacterium]